MRCFSFCCSRFISGLWIVKTHLLNYRTNRPHFDISHKCPCPPMPPPVMHTNHTSRDYSCPPQVRTLHWTMSPVWRPMKDDQCWGGVSISMICSVQQGSSLCAVRMLWSCLRMFWQQWGFKSDHLWDWWWLNLPAVMLTIMAGVKTFKAAPCDAFGP